MVIDTLSLCEKLKEGMDPAAVEKVAKALAGALSQFAHSLGDNWSRKIDGDIQSLREEASTRLDRIE